MTVEIPVHSSHYEAKKFTLTCAGRNRRPLPMTRSKSKNKANKPKSYKNSLTIKKEIRDWLNETAKRHWYIRQYEDMLVLIFHGKDDALMYKLAWYGTER